MLINFNPLEQFSIEGILPNYNSHSLMITSITNMAVLFIIILTTFVIFKISSASYFVTPSRWNIMIEAWVASILGMVKDQIGNNKNTGGPGGTDVSSLIYFPLIFTLFSFILFCNILGLIPYSFATTSHISVTLGFSLAIMIGVTLIGLVNHKLDFFSLFIPAGTPIALVPLLVLIEFISYIARVISLSLRLTANIAAGHCLFGVISALCFSAFLGAGSIFIKGLAIISPIAIIALLYALELLVALLQAYVFALLTCSYMAELINMHSH